MSQTTLAIPKQQNSFKQVKPKTIVGKGENHYVQQEQQQAQHPRGQGRYEQVQDGSRQRGRRQPQAGLQRRSDLPRGRLCRRPDGQEDDRELREEPVKKALSQIADKGRGQQAVPFLL